MQNFTIILEKFIAKAQSFAWGPFTIILLLGAGLYYTIILKGLQFRAFKHAVELIAGKYDDPDHPGEITPFQALSAALSATIGTGNIAGVATAIATGGPGAIFWMWMVGIVGMALKYVSSLLSQKFRVIDKDGVVSGGPMYYLEHGLKQKWLGILFALFTVIASFGIGNMVQANSVAAPVASLYMSRVKGSSLIREDDIVSWKELMKGLRKIDNPAKERLWLLLDPTSKEIIERSSPDTEIDYKSKLCLIGGLNTVIEKKEFYSEDNFKDMKMGDKTDYYRKKGIRKLSDAEIQCFNRLLLEDLYPNAIASSVTEKWVKFAVGLILAFLTAIVIIGGIKRIGAFASKVVPFMCIIYVLGALYVLITHFNVLDDALKLIFTHAFTPTAAVGGFVGSVVMTTIRYGVARGLFSSEAGLGSAPIVHSAAKTDEPVRQGLVAMLGPFIDTLTICTMTALVIISTGVWSNGQTSSVLTMTAFEKGIPYIGEYIVSFGIIFFAFSTLVSWSYYGDRGAEYLLGHKAVNIYRWIYVLLIPAGAVLQIKLVWNISDVFNALMAFPNLIGVLGLGGVVLAMTKDYFKRKPQMDEKLKKKDNG